MTALDHTPTNINLLPPLGFRLYIKKLPNTDFFLQEAQIPAISINPTKHPTPFAPIPYSGDKIDYSPLRVKIKVDENMTNYTELHTWLRGLGFPEDFSEYKALDDVDKEMRGHGEGLVSDASLIILSNIKNPNIEVVFEDMFPVSIGELSFRTTDQDVVHIDCVAEFRYTKFELRVLPK